jgi:hypothetical protein
MNIIMNKGTQEKRRKCVRCMKKILMCGGELKIGSFSISKISISTCQPKKGLN